MTNLDDLLAVVYAHYPRGLSTDDTAYESSLEHRRLVEARRRAGRDNARWHAFLDSVGGQFSEVFAQDGSLHLPIGRMDAAYSGHLFSRKPPHAPALGFLVSFLVPCYVIYTSRFTSGQEATPNRQPHTLILWNTLIILPACMGTREKMPPPQQVLDFAPNDERAGWIAKEIEATWRHERMPVEIGQLVVPDVTTPGRVLGEATLYDCLFTDDW